MTDLVRRGWRALHPGLRPVVVTLLAAGVALGVLGAVGDAAGFWSRLPFLTNLASSLTAALFGLPVALVVVQRLLQVQAEANDRAAAWRLATRSAHHLRVAAGALPSLDRLTARYDAELAGAAAWADRAFAAKPRPRRLRASMYQRTYLRHVLAAHRTAGEVADLVAAAGPATARIRTEAAFLSDEVRPMVLRAGGEWRPGPAVEHLAGTAPVAATALRELLDAVPADQLAALLAEPDEARAGLPDPDSPMPLPAVQVLERTRAELGALAARLDRFRRAEGVQAAIAGSAPR